MLSACAIAQSVPSPSAAGQHAASILPFDDVSPLEVDAADRCAICRLMYNRVLNRLGTEKRMKDPVNKALEEVCDHLRMPERANTSQHEGRKLMQVADACNELLDSHSDDIERAVISGESAHDVCGRLVRVCYAADEL